MEGSDGTTGVAGRAEGADVDQGERDLVTGANIDREGDMATETEQ